MPGLMPGLIAQYVTRHNKSYLMSILGENMKFLLYIIQKKIKQAFQWYQTNSWKLNRWFLLFSLYFTSYFAQYLKISLADITYFLLCCVTFSIFCSVTTCILCSNCLGLHLPCTHLSWIASPMHPPVLTWQFILMSVIVPTIYEIHIISMQKIYTDFAL